jgi:hypothetical protein
MKATRRRELSPDPNDASQQVWKTVADYQQCDPGPEVRPINCSPQAGKSRLDIIIHI